MTTPKKETKAAADNLKPSPMEYVSSNMPPRVIAGTSGASEADMPGAGPAAPDPSSPLKDL